MDILEPAVDKFLEGGREVYEGLYDFFTHPNDMWSRFENVDPRVGGVVIILFTLGIGFVVLTLLANTISAPSSTAKPSSDGAVHRKDAPPIPPPTEVVSLRIYPIKSCRGFEVSGTRLRRSGLTLDRNWMFISLEDRKFLTIRSDPSMTLIDTSLVDDPDTKEQMLRISIHGHEELVDVPAFPTRSWLEANTKLSKVEIWEQETDGWQYADEINQIFSKFFNKSVALIYKGPTARNVAINGAPEVYGSAIPHHFADVMSLQVASEASIHDLNRRLREKGVVGTSTEDLTIERFRPNIIVRGRDDHPWEEDGWKRVRLITRLDDEQAVYKIDLDVVARCARCQVPNVEPSTAHKHPKEPWDELMKFRRIDSGGPAKYKPCFGMMCIPKTEGRVQVGATLEVLEMTGNHLYMTRKFTDL